MRREEFLRQLEQLLMDISEEERKEALRFYESYFEDAGEANEEKILKELESPQKVADTIKKELGENAGGSAERHDTAYGDAVNSDTINNELSDNSNDVFQKKSSVKREKNQEKYIGFHSNGKQRGNSSYHENYSYGGNDGYDTYGNSPQNDGCDTYDSYGNSSFQSYEEGDYTEEKKQGMPMWAKVLIIAAICVAGVIFILFIVAMVLGISFAQNVTDKVLDEVAEEVTDKVFDNTIDSINGIDGIDDLEDIDDLDDIEDSLENWWNGTENKDADTVYGEYEEGASVIDIDMKGGKLTFERSDTGNIKYEINGIEKDLEVALDDNKFVLVDHRERADAVKEKGSVVVYLPEMQFETVRVKNDAALIYWEDFLQAKNVEITVAAGEISIEHIRVDELMNINIGAGIGTIEDAAAGKLQIDCGTGQINYEGLINGDAEIICGVGDVELEIEDQERNFNYELSCGIGCIDSENWSYTKLTNGRKIDNNANKTLKLDCGVGVILLDFEDDDDIGSNNGNNSSSISDSNGSSNTGDSNGNNNNTNNSNGNSNTSGSNGNNNSNINNSYGNGTITHHPETHHSEIH